MDLPGIGSTVCLDLLATSRLPEIAELISSVTCHMFIHVPPMQLSDYAKRINGFLGQQLSAFFSRAHAVASSLFQTKLSSSHRSSERIVHLQPNEMGTNSNHTIYSIS